MTVKLSSAEDRALKTLVSFDNPTIDVFAMVAQSTGLPLQTVTLAHHCSLHAISFNSFISKMNLSEPSLAIWPLRTKRPKSLLSEVE